MYHINQLKQILENLCYYDKRNPDNKLEDIDENDIYIGGIGVKPDTKSCYCNNCFYGRTKLAEELLKYVK